MHNTMLRAVRQKNVSVTPGRLGNYLGDVFLPMIPMPFLHFLFLRQTFFLHFLFLRQTPP